MNIPRWVKNIKAIGWDLDGTLYPSSHSLTKEIKDRQLKAAMAKNNWNKNKAKNNYVIKLNYYKSNTKTLTSLGVDGETFFTSIWDELPLERFIKKDIKIITLFKKLKSFPHFIITNSNKKNQIVKKLNLIGLKPSLFKVIVTSVGLKAVKPDKKPFKLALSLLNKKRTVKINPYQILYVGDREKTDINGAKNFGFKSGLVYTKKGKAPKTKADILLNSVYDVAALFK